MDRIALIAELGKPMTILALLETGKTTVDQESLSFAQWHEIFYLIPRENDVLQLQVLREIYAIAQTFTDYSELHSAQTGIAAVSDEDRKQTTALMREKAQTFSEHLIAFRYLLGERVRDNALIATEFDKLAGFATTLEQWMSLCRIVTGHQLTNVNFNRDRCLCQALLLAKDSTDFQAILFSTEPNSALEQQVLALVLQAYTNFADTILAFYRFAIATNRADGFYTRKNIILRDQLYQQACQLARDEEDWVFLSAIAVKFHLPINESVEVAINTHFRDSVASCEKLIAICHKPHDDWQKKLGAANACHGNPPEDFKLAVFDHCITLMVQFADSLEKCRQVLKFLNPSAHIFARLTLAKKMITM